MTANEILTNWLVKYGMEWVDFDDAQSLFYDVEWTSDTRAIVWGLHFAGLLDREKPTLATQGKFRLTQKATDYINEH